MSPLAIAILAIGMSIDACLAAIGRGASLHRPRLSDALRTGFVFGLVETVTPLIGWTAGYAASGYVAAVDHWIAFGLLSLVGGRMIHHSFQDAPAVRAVDANRGSLILFATALGTSIDAMVVGVSLAFLDVNIIVVAIAIGTATFVMSTGGMMTGRMIGLRFGRTAERLGGLALIALGLSILVRHLSA